MESLLRNAADIAKTEKDMLCAEADKLQEVIEHRRHEYDVLKEHFDYCSITAL